MPAPCHRATLPARWFGLPWRHTTRARPLKQHFAFIAWSDLERRCHPRLISFSNLAHAGSSQLYLRELLRVPTAPPSSRRMTLPLEAGFGFDQIRLCQGLDHLVIFENQQTRIILDIRPGSQCLLARKRILRLHCFGLRLQILQAAFHLHHPRSLAAGCDWFCGHLPICLFAFPRSSNCWSEWIWSGLRQKSNGRGKSFCRSKSGQKVFQVPVRQKELILFNFFPGEIGLDKALFSPHMQLIRVRYFLKYPRSSSGSLYALRECGHSAGEMPRKIGIEMLAPNGEN